MQTLTPAVPTVKLTEAEVRLLASLEWDYIQLDTQIANLGDRLHQIDRPEARASAGLLYEARLKLRQALDAIDVPLTVAVQRAELLGQPPF